MGLRDWLLGRSCVFCRVRGQAGLCDDCQQALPWRLEQDDEVLAPLAYSGRVRESVLRFKFGGAAWYADVYALLLAQLLHDRSVRADVIAYIPLSPGRLRQRGYNQVRVLARRTGIPCRRLLSKPRGTASQSRTSGGEARRQNVAGAFRAVGPVTGTVLLLDDVYTTGSTMREAMTTLLHAGAARVIPMCLCRTPSKQTK